MTSMAGSKLACRLVTSFSSTHTQSSHTNSNTITVLNSTDQLHYICIMTKDCIYVLLTLMYVHQVHNIVVLLQTASNSQAQHSHTKLVHKNTSTNLDIQWAESICPHIFNHIIIYAFHSLLYCGMTYNSTLQTLYYIPEATKQLCNSISLN